MAYSQKSLALSEELDDKIVVSGILSDIANIYGAQGNYELALEYADRAITVARLTQSSGGLTRALVAAGRAFRSLKQPDKSKQAFEEAISTIELSRTTIASHDARATYLAAFQDPYDLYIDLLMQMHREDPGKGFDVLASNVGERARARSLLEFLNETPAAVQNGADPESLHRLQLVRQQLNAQAEQWSQLTGGKYSVEQASKIQKEMDATIQQYREVEAEIRTNSPRYAALTHLNRLALLKYSVICSIPTPFFLNTLWVKNKAIFGSLPRFIKKLSTSEPGKSRSSCTACL
jgi:tetratricopeptide (TPR) repeat protein